MRKLLIILLLSIPVCAQTIIQTSAQLGMKCDGVTDDTQRFLNALGIGSGVSNVYIIFVNGTCNIKSINPITVPSTITLDFTQAGALSLASGSTMNVSASIVDADYHPVFLGLGTYNLTPRNPVTCAAIAGGSACAPSGGVSTGTNVTAQGVLTSNTAAQNQTAFAAIATAVNAGSISPYIYIPAGTYNILTTGSSGLGTYSQTGVIHCENPSTTVLNFSGTGQVATIGKTGLTTSSAYIWTPFIIENCQFTGGASLTEGILIPSENWGAEIRYNYFTNFGNATMFAVHGQQDTWFKLIGNNYYRNDGVLGKVAYLGPTASPSVYGLLEAYYNKIICTISATNANTTPCGVGLASELYLIAQHNVMSGPVPLIRCGTAVGSSTSSSALSCQINDNILEIFGSSTFGVQFGTPGAGSAEGTFGMLVTNNHVYLASTMSFVGPASANSGLANSTFSGNILRHDSLGSANPMVTLNNLTGQTGNSAFNNQGFTNPLHTHVSNVGAWTVSTNQEVDGCSEESSAAGIDAGQCLFRSTATNLYSIVNIVPNGTGSANLTGGIGIFNTDYTANQTNYENFQLLWNTNKMTLNVNKSGSGTLRALGIQYGGSDRFGFDASGNPFITNAPAASGVLSVTGTGACATTSTTAGGAWGGKVTCTGTTGASTLAITFGSTGPNGSSCFGSDVTAKIAGAQSAIGTTICTLNWATVTQNDVLTFGVIAW